MAQPNDRTPLLAVNSEIIASEDTKLELYNGMPSKRAFIWLVTGLWSLTFLGALDGTIVATLLTPIGSSFNASNRASFLGTSYLLSVCCFTPIYGRLSDILGRRFAILLGVSLFTLGTIGCGIAPSMNSLIAARALAGAGGGGMAVVGGIIISDLVPLKRRGLYQGMVNCCFGLGGGLGGPLGGFFSDNFGWRWAFLIQIPLLMISITLLLLHCHLPHRPSPTGEPQTLLTKFKRIDFLGSFVLAISVSCVLLAMTFKTGEAELPWSDPSVWALLLAGGIAAVGFLGVEAWVQEPVMPLRLMTFVASFSVALGPLSILNFDGSTATNSRRNPAIIAVVNWLLSVVSFSTLYNVPLFFSSVLLTSSSISGTHLLPNSIALAFGSVAAGAYMRLTGKFYWMTAFMGCCMVGSNAMLVTWTKDSPEWILWIAIVPGGFGVAGILTSTLVALIGSVDKEDIACSTGISYLFRTTGQVLGVSLSSALTQAVLQRDLLATITGPDADEIITRIRHDTDSIRQLPPDTKELAVAAFQHALTAVFIFQLAMSALMLVVALGMKEVDLPDKEVQKVISDEEEAAGRSMIRITT